ncbi:MAG: glycosyltransferase family 4 protein [candidate division WOR-3 bacterium]
MRIGFPLMSLRHHGGVRVIVDFANHLSKRGHDVHIFVPKNQFFPLYPINEDVRVHLLRNSNEEGFFSRLKTLYDLAEAMSSVELEVVVANFFPTAYSSYFMRKRAKVIYLVQDVPLFYGRTSPMGLLLRLSMGFPYPKVAISQYIAQTLRASAEIISLGVSDAFYPEPDPELLSEKQHPAILYFPRKQAYKGMEYFIEAVRIMSGRGLRFEIWLVTQEEEALNPFEDMDIPCFLMNGQDDNQLRRLYSSADLFVSSSVAEGFSLPPLEAMACGTPVVMAECGGAWDYAEPESNAIVVPAKNPEALADGIQRVISDPVLANRLRESGLETARRFTASQAARRFEDFLMRACAN